MRAMLYRNGYAWTLVAALATTVLVVMGSLAQAVLQAQVFY